MNLLRTAAALAMGCIVLTGCVPSPSTAFTVNGEVITEKQVDAAAAGCAPLFDRTPTDLRIDVVNNLLVGKLGQLINHANGLELTEGERRTFLEGSAQGQLMLSDPECAKVADGLATYLLGLDRLGEAAFSEGVRTADIVVNPKYGDWLPEQGVIGGSGSLSELDPKRS